MIGNITSPNLKMKVPATIMTKKYYKIPSKIGLVGLTCTYGMIQMSILGKQNNIMDLQCHVKPGSRTNIL